MKLSDLKKQKPSQEDVLGILKDIAENSRSNDAKKAATSLIEMIDTKSINPDKKNIDNAIYQIQQAYPEEINNIYRLNDNINKLINDRKEKIGSQINDIIQSLKNEEKKQNSDPVPPVTNNDTNAATDSIDKEIDNLIQGLGTKQTPATAADKPADAKDTTAPPSMPPISEGSFPPITPPNSSTVVDAAPVVTVDAAPENPVDAAPAEKVDAAPAPNAPDLPPPPTAPPPPPPITASEDAKVNTAADNISVETRSRANAVSGKDAKTDAQAAMREVRNEQRKGWDKLIKAHRNKIMDEKKDAAPNTADTTNESRSSAVSMGGDEKKQPEPANNASSNAQNFQKSASLNNAAINQTAKTQSSELYKSNKVMVEVLQFAYKAARFVGNLTKSERNAAMQNNQALAATEEKQSDFNISRVKSYFSVKIIADLLGEQRTNAIKQAVNAVVDKAASLKKSIIVLGGEPEAKQMLTDAANKKSVPNQTPSNDGGQILNSEQKQSDTPRVAR